MILIFLQTIQEGGSRAGSPQEGVATYSYSQQVLLHHNATDCTGPFKSSSLLVYLSAICSLFAFSLSWCLVFWCDVHLSIGDLGSGEISSNFFLSASELCPSCYFYIQLLSKCEFSELSKSPAGFKHDPRAATTPTHTGQARFVQHNIYNGMCAIYKLISKVVLD